jgi:hypothetical protein
VCIKQRVVYVRETEITFFVCVCVFDKHQSLGTRGKDKLDEKRDSTNETQQMYTMQAHNSDRIFGSGVEAWCVRKLSGVPKADRKLDLPDGRSEALWRLLADPDEKDADAA